MIKTVKYHFLLPSNSPIEWKKFFLNSLQYLQEWGTMNEKHQEITPWHALLKYMYLKVERKQVNNAHPCKVIREHSTGAVGNRKGEKGHECFMFNYHYLELSHLNAFFFQFWLSGVWYCFANEMLWWKCMHVCMHESVI